MPMADIYKKISKEEVEAFIEEYPRVKQWLHGKSESARTRYPKSLMRYCRYHGKNPDELIEIRKEDRRNAEHTSEMMLKEFVANTNFSGNSMTMHVAAIRSFYMFNMEGLAKRCVNVGQRKTKPYKCPTPLDLRKMEQGQSLRNILCIRLTSCGFREGSEAKLTWGHIWDELFDENGNLIWDGETPVHVSLMQYELKGKTSKDYSGVEQHAFLYPNVINILLKYKEWLETVLIPRLAKRTRYDKQFEKAENLEKFRITRETPILLSLYSNSKGELYGVKPQEIYRMIVKASKGKYSPQDLRRYAETQLEESNTMPDRWRKKILGHKISGEENPYSRPKIKALREKFIEAIPFIDYTVDSDSIMEKRKLQARCEELKEALAQKSQALAIAMTVAQDLKFLSQFVLRLQAHGIPPDIVMSEYTAKRRVLVREVS